MVSSRASVRMESLVAKNVDCGAWVGTSVMALTLGSSLCLTCEASLWEELPCPAPGRNKKCAGKCPAESPRYISLRLAPHCRLSVLASPALLPKLL